MLGHRSLCEGLLIVGRPFAGTCRVYADIKLNTIRRGSLLDTNAKAYIISKVPGAQCNSPAMFNHEAVRWRCLYVRRLGWPAEGAGAMPLQADKASGQLKLKACSLTFQAVHMYLSH